MFGRAHGCLLQPANALYHNSSAGRKLAPRDVVTRHLQSNATLLPFWFCVLKFKHLKSWCDQTIFDHLSHAIKIQYRSQRIVPIASGIYMVGGIRTDLHGETNIKGLFACGEVASTGVMEPTDLQSNSLLECLVFGRRAMKNNKRTYANPALPELTEIHINPANENLFLEIKTVLPHWWAKKRVLFAMEKNFSRQLTNFHEIGSFFRTNHRIQPSWK